MVTVGADSTVQENVGTVISITMYSQTLNFGQNGVITLPDNSTVNVAWSYNPGTSSVVLIVTSTAMGLVIPSHKDTLKSISHQGELASL